MVINNAGEGQALKLKEIQKILGAEVLTVGIGLDLEVGCIKASDLMSDVLNAPPGACSLLLTGLSNSAAIRTVTVADLSAIVFVRGKIPSEETIQLAILHHVPLMTTKLSMYEACGRLFASGIPDVCEP